MSEDVVVVDDAARFRRKPTIAESGQLSDQPARQGGMATSPSY